MDVHLLFCVSFVVLNIRSTYSIKTETGTSLTSLDIHFTCKNLYPVGFPMAANLNVTVDGASGTLRKFWPLLILDPPI